MNQQPVKKDIVLVGGGHSHVAVLKNFGMNPIPGVRLTLITRDLHTPYSGMLPGLIAGHYSFDEAHVDLRPLAIFANARCYHDRVTGIDFNAKTVRCANRPDVHYDLLSINAGSTPHHANIPGVTEHAIPVKPIDQFLVKWNDLRERINAHPDKEWNLNVVGGGAGGVELLLSLHHHLPEKAHVNYRLIARSGDILETHNPAVRAKFNRIMGERGIEIATDEAVSSIGTNNIMCESGRIIKSDATFWVTHGVAGSWLEDTELETDELGSIIVNEYLQSVNRKDVFASGDNAHLSKSPRPKSGVFAVRAGPPLAENLRRRVQGRPLKSWRPQKQFLSLVSTGNQYAVLSRGPIALEGDWVWKLKDWIDQRWMQKYREFPSMATTATPSLPGKSEAGAKMVMHCAGCGSKIGSSILHRALKAVDSVNVPGMIKGFNQPDDAAVVEPPAGKVSVETVDFFRAFMQDPYLFTRITVNHCLSDIFAMGADAHHALAMITLPHASDYKLENELREVMIGATEQMNAAGCALAGGHTNEGPELIFGLSVTGYIERDHLLNKGGAQPGEVIILTKPIGTGTILAADMQSKARGRWVSGAIEMMLRSNQQAAAILHNHHASSCTDVTGFGLIGHLLEMVKQSEINVSVKLASIPLLDGALETTSMGILSSLHPSNIQADSFIANREEAEQAPAYNLLFDPQTSGGLLATVPFNAYTTVLQELHEAGYPYASVVGEVKPKSDMVYPIRVNL